MKGRSPQTAEIVGRRQVIELDRNGRSFYFKAMWPFRFYFALAVVLLVSGCRGEQSMLDPKGPSAEDIADIWWWMFWGSLFILTLVMGLAFYAVFRHPDKRLSIRGSPMVLMGGILLPILALTPLMFFGFMAGHRALAFESDALTIRVVGHRFWWEVRYEDPQGQGVVATANEVRIPAGRPVNLQLESTDVIHSFWVPNLAGKMDVLPGKPNRLKIEAAEPGIFRGQCAEFCGALHAHMVFHVIAEDEAAFQAWLSAQSKPAIEPANEALQRGQRAFVTRGCAQCHQIRGTQATGTGGPDLTHVGSRHMLGSGMVGGVTADNIAAWTVSKEHMKPGAAIPQFGSDDQPVLQDIALYLESLK